MGISDYQYQQMLARLEKSQASSPKTPEASDSLEAELHEEIMQYCRLRSWIAVHSRMDKRSTVAKGVTDFIIVTPQTVMFIECKRPGKERTEEQLAFAQAVKTLDWPYAVVHTFQEFLEFAVPLCKSPNARNAVRQ